MRGRRGNMGENDALGRVDEVRVYGDCSLVGGHRVEAAGVRNKLRASWRMRRDRIQSLLRLHGRRRLSECQGRESVMANGRQEHGVSQEAPCSY
jgi:hypothetical protein